MSRIVRMTGVAVLAALALGACGGGGKIGGPQAATAKKADGICADAQDKVGKTLGDDPAADRDAIRAASDALMAIKAPSENINTWTLFIQNVNNLWISLDDVSQALDPNVNDTARAARARLTVKSNNNKVKRYADQYEATTCAEGFGRS